MHPIDLTGRVFDRLTVLRQADERRRGYLCWVCRCSCGKEHVVKGIDLRSGNVKSCGCLSREQIDDLTGQRFGRWTVLRLAASSRTGLTRWECRCDCGTVKAIHASALKSGHTQSCGCYRSEMLSTRSIKHGYAKVGKKTVEYNCWIEMHRRCYNPNCKCFRYYGGDGIRVCERWHGPDGFVNFLADMGERPVGLTIERKDVKANYSPENCIWATRKQQSRNRRDTIKLTFRGEEKPLADWADIVGIKIHTIYLRLRAGWPVDRALTAPMYARVKDSRKT